MSARPSQRAPRCGSDLLDRDLGDRLGSHDRIAGNPSSSKAPQISLDMSQWTLPRSARGSGLPGWDAGDTGRIFQTNRSLTMNLARGRSASGWFVAAGSEDQLVVVQWRAASPQRRPLGDPPRTQLAFVMLLIVESLGNAYLQAR